MNARGVGLQVCAPKNCDSANILFLRQKASQTKTSPMVIRCNAHNEIKEDVKSLFNSTIASYIHRLFVLSLAYGSKLLNVASRSCYTVGYPKENLKCPLVLSTHYTFDTKNK